MPWLQSESEEGFLRFGTAKSAVPSVGMTNCWRIMWKNPTSAE